ncbi:MAG: hypothetical protein JWQ43_462 [Glaciihabitans sp.]|nr:hypothetical protein [Glaciihabitans sp.]
MLNSAAAVIIGVNGVAQPDRRGMRRHEAAR